MNRTRHTILLSIMFLYRYIGLGPFGMKPSFSGRSFLVLFTWFAACHPLKAPAWRWPSALSLKKHNGFMTFSIKSQWFHNMFSLRFHRFYQSDRRLEAKPLQSGERDMQQPV